MHEQEDAKGCPAALLDALVGGGEVFFLSHQESNQGYLPEGKYPEEPEGQAEANQTKSDCRQECVQIS